ncbi:hypothetical protein PSA01_29840 [Pseudonocardia saturnea]|uniref:Uncharacterized protein n=1 Tax=Pseudonocardia saturnea TaxID=33909 RepID=A0ABQ0RZ53_9PSEU|nr:hypothetical protein PSA01_29840 [Pseudonocardia saturnea]
MREDNAVAACQGAASGGDTHLRHHSADRQAPYPALAQVSVESGVSVTRDTVRDDSEPQGRRQIADIVELDGSRPWRILN